MRVRFVKENLARLAEQYRGYLGEKDLEDNKEYTVCETSQIRSFARGSSSIILLGWA